MEPNSKIKLRQEHTLNKYKEIINSLVVGVQHSHTLATWERQVHESLLPQTHTLDQQTLALHYPRHSLWPHTHTSLHQQHSKQQEDCFEPPPILYKKRLYWEWEDRINLHCEHIIVFNLLILLFLIRNHCAKISYHYLNYMYLAWYVGGLCVCVCLCMYACVLSKTCLYVAYNSKITTRTLSAACSLNSLFCEDVFSAGKSCLSG